MPTILPCTGREGDLPLARHPVEGRRGHLQLRLRDPQVVSVQDISRQWLRPNQQLRRQRWMPFQPRALLSLELYFFRQLSEPKRGLVDSLACLSGIGVVYWIALCLSRHPSLFRAD